MTRQNRIGRCPQRLGGRPNPGLRLGLDKKQEIRKALGTKDPACYGHFQATPLWSQHALGRQRAPNAVLTGGSSGLLTDCIGGILCPIPGSTTVS